MMASVLAEGVEEAAETGSEKKHASEHAEQQQPCLRRAHSKHRREILP
jgi:hypothetical protein